LVRRGVVEVVEVAARDPMMVGALERRDEPIVVRQAAEIDADANAGSDYDAMPEDADADADTSQIDLPPAEPAHLAIPNSVFRPARILVNPRCPTTYAGVSHTQLALDLFGTGDAPDGGAGGLVGKYVLEDWEGAPESFVCQEQRCVHFFNCVVDGSFILPGKRGDARHQKHSDDSGSLSTTSCGATEPAVVRWPNT
jgi:hypothetical protein